MSLRLFFYRCVPWFFLAISTVALCEPSDSHEDVAPSQDQEDVSSSPQEETPVERNMRSFPVKEVKVSGNQRVDTQSIQDRLPSQETYTVENLNAYMKTLFDTGLFSDIKIRMEGATLHVHVDENLSLNQIVFEGNKDLSDKELRDALQDIRLTPRESYTTARVQEAIQILLALYRMKGRYCVKIVPALIKRESNRVDLVFQIDEGPKSYIRSITFVGAKKIDPSELSLVISSREERWYRVLGGPEECYDEDRIRYDRENLRQFYLANGYVDFRVISHSAELSENKKDFFLTFILHEGEKYFFGKTALKSEMPSLSQEILDEIQEIIPWEEGDTFNAKLLQEFVDKATYLLSKKNQFFVQITPISKKDGPHHRIDLQLVLSPGQACYVNSIHIFGNWGTNEDVIRRYLAFAEGDALNDNRLSLSERRLQSLDFFESVEVMEKPTANPGYKDVIIRVKEKGTGDLQARGGYSSVDGLLADVSYTERNFLGRGQALHFGLEGSSRGYNVDLGMNIPYCMGRPMSVGWDVFQNMYRGTIAENQDQEERSGYQQKVTGGVLTTNYMLRRNLYQGWAYKLRHDNLNLKKPKRLSIYITENMIGHEKQWLSNLEHNLGYDRVAWKKGARVGGYAIRMVNQFIGLGGDIHAFMNTFFANFYQAFGENEQILLRLELRYGFIGQMGYMRFIDQFNTSEYFFPGFRENGIGPRDTLTKDALRGKQYYTAALKLDFPLGLPKELPIKGIVFVEAGSLWNTMFEGPNIVGDELFTRITSGAGLVAELPIFGRIGFLYSLVLRKQDQDQPKHFMIIYGKEF